MTVSGDFHERDPQAFLTITILGSAAIAMPRVTRAEEKFQVEHSEEEWRKLLTPDQLAVLLKGATERPYNCPS